MWKTFVVVSWHFRRVSGRSLCDVSEFLGVNPSHRFTPSAKRTRGLASYPGKSFIIKRTGRFQEQDLQAVNPWTLSGFVAAHQECKSTVTEKQFHILPGWTFYNEISLHVTEVVDDFPKSSMTWWLLCLHPRGSVFVQRFLEHHLFLMTTSCNEVKIIILRCLIQFGRWTFALIANITPGLALNFWAFKGVVAAIMFCLLMNSFPRIFVWNRTMGGNYDSVPASAVSLLFIVCGHAASHHELISKAIH